MPKGKVRIEYRFKNGMKRVEEHENVVVLGGLQKIIDWICPGTPDPVAKMQWGAGGAAAVQTDDMLYNPIMPIKDADITFPVGDVKTVKFEATLERTEGNGFPIAEIGLMTDDGVLFARKALAGMAKTADYEINYQWIINMKG